jgi:hypothetical protein
VFATALLFNLARGLDIACGCFDTAGGEGAATWLYILRDLALLALGVHVFLFDQGVASVSRLIKKERDR